MASATNMKLKCKCGSIFSVAMELIGKIGQCKKCGIRFRIPGKKAAAIPLENPVNRSTLELAPKASPKKVTQTPCPSCRKDMGRGTIVCISCGYHTKTKKRLKSFDGIANDSDKSDDQFVAALFLFPAALALMMFAWFWQSGMKGPTYLNWYFGLFVIVGALLPLVRKFLWDVDTVNHAAAFALIGIGAIRIVESVSAGKYKLLFLVIGMALAVTVFLGTKTNRNQHRNSPFVDAFGSLVAWAYYILLAIVVCMMAGVFFTPIGKATAHAAGIVVMAMIGLFVCLAAWLADNPPGKKSWVDSLDNCSSDCSSCSSCGSSCGGGCGGGCGGCGD